MKTLYKYYFLILLFVPISAFGQITYTFDVDGNGYTADAGATYTNMVPYGTTTLATMETKTLSALTAPAGADGNTSLVFHGLTKLSGINTMSVDLTAFTGSNDQQVVWKTYLKSATTATRAGVMLRAQSTVSGYASGVRQGYYFSVVGTTTSGTVSYRITKFTSATSVTDLKAATNAVIPGFTTGPLYLRAKAVGTTLSLEYSTNGTSWTLFSGASVTDAAFSAGTVQLTYGLGGGSNLDQYVDDVTITNLSTPKVTFTGTNKFEFTGAGQGAASATTSYFTTTPSLTYSYKGIGATSYVESSSQPTAPGHYIALVSASAGLESAKDTLAYEILPAKYSKYYTFNNDTKGAIAANTYNRTATNHLVQAGLGYFYNASGANSYRTTGNMLQSTGNAITTLATFGATDSIASDYQVIWKDYASATGQKRGVILRGAGTNAFLRVNNNITNVGQGYMFYVNNSAANTLQLDIRKLQSDTTTYKSASILATNTALTYNGVNTATWYKATVNADSLIFEYSTDGSNWISAHRIKDDGTTYGAVYTSGTTQVSSINSGGTSYYFDYFGFDTMSQLTTDIEKPSTGNNMIVSVSNNTLTVANVSNFVIYNIQGVKVKEIVSNSTTNTVSLTSGMYIIRSGNSTLKAIVK